MWEIDFTSNKSNKIERAIKLILFNRKKFVVLEKESSIYRISIFSKQFFNFGKQFILENVQQSQLKS